MLRLQDSLQQPASPEGYPGEVHWVLRASSCRMRARRGSARPPRPACGRPCGSPAGPTRTVPRSARRPMRRRRCRPGLRPDWLAPPGSGSPASHPAPARRRTPPPGWRTHRGRPPPSRAAPGRGGPRTRRSRPAPRRTRRARPRRIRGGPRLRLGGLADLRDLRRRQLVLGHRVRAGDDRLPVQWPVLDRATGRRRPRAGVRPARGPQGPVPGAFTTSVREIDLELDLSRSIERISQIWPWKRGNYRVAGSATRARKRGSPVAPSVTSIR